MGDGAGIAQKLAELNNAIRLNCGLPLEQVPEKPQDELFMVELNSNPEPNDVARMNARLLKRPGVLGVLWSSPPSSEVKDEDAWDAVIESGVPVIIWLRESPEQPGDDKDPKKIFDQMEWNNLASEVQRLRLDAVAEEDDAWHVGRHLAIILDDPRHPLLLASEASDCESPASS